MKRHGGTLNAYQLSKRSQSEKTICCIIVTLRHLEKAKLRRQETDQWLPEAGVEGRVGYKWPQGNNVSDITIL